MPRARKIFAVHPGEILKTEFMELMGVSAYALAKALSFPGIYEVVRGDRAISADTAVRLGKYFGLPAQFWLNLQNDYDLRIAESSGIGRGIKPRNVNYHPEFRASVVSRAILGQLPRRSVRRGTRL
jgi:addiction module HigA family antidote